jgi:hypothetical protein
VFECFGFSSLCWYLKVLFENNAAVVRLVCYFLNDSTTTLKYLVLVWVLIINFQLNSMMGAVSHAAFVYSLTAVVHNYLEQN